jgi:hypothetical protein
MDTLGAAPLPGACQQAAAAAQPTRRVLARGEAAAGGALHSVVLDTIRNVRDPG